MNIPDVIREKATQMSPEQLEKYISGVEDLLKAMKTGDVLVISSVSKTRNRDLFIEVAKWYMRKNRDTYMDGLTFTKGFIAIQKYVFIPFKKRTKESKNVTL
jgi:hypothetical protein